MTLRPLLLVLALVLTLLPQAARAQVDLPGLQDQATALAREGESLLIAIDRQSGENTRLVGTLEAPDGAGEPATFEGLRQAQFAVDIARTRLLTLDHRIAQQDARLAALNSAIVEASARLRAAPEDTLQRIMEEAALEWLGRIRIAAQNSVQSLRTYQTLSADYLSLRQEELAILQRRISLNALEGFDPGFVDPVIDRLRTLIAELAQSALALSNEAAAVTETNPIALRRRNMLSARADEATLRSNARLTDVEIVMARNMVRGLQPLLSEPAAPTRLYDDAAEALAAQIEELGERATLTIANAAALDDFERVVAGASDEGEAVALLMARMAGLRQLLRTQLTELGDLREQLATLRDELIREKTQIERGRLLQRELTRTDRAGRERIRKELDQLPGELRAIYGARLSEIRAAVSIASDRALALFAASALAIIALIIVLRQVVLRRFISAEATRATEVPLEVLRRNLYWLLPIALWAVFTHFFAISTSTTNSVYPLLAIPAAAALLRDLTQVIVSRRKSASGQRMGGVITRAMEVAMALTALVVFAYVIVGEVPLLPSTQSALNRLAYSVFVLAGLPMLLFVFFFAGSASSGRAHRLRDIVAAVLSLLPPTALIATGLVGLVGYTHLSALMLENLALAIIIIAALALALGVLYDLLEGVAGRIRADDPARAYFVSHNFLEPLYRVGQISFAIVALAVAWSVFDWTRETPVIRELLAFWNQRLFSAGDTTYRIGTVVIALSALLFVFWTAAWSRRVTYSVLLRRMKDIGIRQSLSVFTQYVVVVLGVLLTLSAIGFDVTTLTVFAASLGVGIGFGLQNVVNNFISGLILLVERPLRLGDIVTVGANSGTVSQIGIRSMRMKTFDEFDLMVPNSQLISDTFTNWTRTNSVMRVLLTVGVGYDDAPDHAAHLVEDILQEHKGVVASPAPMVTVDEFGDSSINLRVCYYIDLRGEMSGFVVRSEVLSAIWRRFREEGITIPYPQRDVHLMERQVLALPKKDAGAAAPRRRERDEWVADAIEMVDGDEGRE